MRSAAGSVTVPGVAIARRVASARYAAGLETDELRRLDQTVEERGDASPAFGARAVVILAADGERPHPTLDVIGIERERGFGEEGGEPRPEVERVADGLAERRFGEHRMRDTPRPDRGHERRALRPPTGLPLGCTRGLGERPAARLERVEVADQPHDLAGLRVMRRGLDKLPADVRPAVRELKGGGARGGLLVTERWVDTVAVGDEPAR